METVDIDLSPCIVCGSRVAKQVQWLTDCARSLFGGSIVQCSGCGVAFVYPMPSIEKVKAVYASPEYINAYAKAEISYISGKDTAEGYIVDRIARVECLRGGRRGLMLDIGAARGAFLDAARTRGWEVVGLELGVDAARVAREERGLDVRSQALEEAQLDAESVDAVHMSHVLEHLVDPVGTLASIRRVLADGGVLAIEVPAELGDLLSSIEHGLLGRKREPYPVPSSHTYFFTPKTLGRLVRQAGFRVVSVRTPRRNRNCESRIPLGAVAKWMAYGLEGLLCWGPNIEVLAVKE